MWKSIRVSLLLLGVSTSLINCGFNDTQEQVELIKNSVEKQVSKRKELVWDKDNTRMVLIPAGYFEMGSRNNVSNEKPVHKVEVSAFYMDVHEVTVGQFQKFVSETGYRYDLWDNVARYSPEVNYPMIYLSWKDALAYAEWAGKRLPTEAEWEYAARGGLIGKKYIWGDDLFQARDYANCHGIDGKDKWPQCAPVGSFTPNGYGLYDMAGNAWEWTSDWYDERYYRISPAKDPFGPVDGKYKVLRGGSWSYLPINLRVAKRECHDPSGSSSGGRRCVSTPKD